MSGKIIKALHKKKERDASKKFLVEGTKSVQELLKSDFQIENLYVTADFNKANAALLEKRKEIRVQVVDAGELNAFGTLEHNDGALAIVKMKPTKAPTGTGVILALDDIRDPGNLGTLIRIADWYGVKEIVCSETTVDWYNPKVIAASMGSFTRVSGFYTNLPAYLKGKNALGAFMKGKSVHDFEFPSSGVLVIGSESHGISKETEKVLTEKITIPSFGGGAESLNAAIAGAIILDRWIPSIKK